MAKIYRLQEKTIKVKKNFKFRPFLAYLENSFETCEKLLYSQTWANDHLSTTVTISGSRGWLSYSGLTAMLKLVRL
jgi:hypothetical protein